MRRLVRDEAVAAQWMLVKALEHSTAEVEILKHRIVQLEEKVEIVKKRAP